MISLLSYSKFIKTGVFQNRCKNNTYSIAVFDSLYVIQHKKRNPSIPFFVLLGQRLRALFTLIFWRRH